MYIQSLPAVTAGLSFIAVAAVMPITIFIMMIYIRLMNYHVKL